MTLIDKFCSRKPASKFSATWLHSQSICIKVSKIFISQPFFVFTENSFLRYLVLQHLDLSSLSYSRETASLRCLYIYADVNRMLGSTKILKFRYISTTTIKINVTLSNNCSILKWHQSSLTKKKYFNFLNVFLWFLMPLCLLQKQENIITGALISTFIF